MVEEIALNKDSFQELIENDAVDLLDGAHLMHWLKK